MALVRASAMTFSDTPSEAEMRHAYDQAMAAIIKREGNPLRRMALDLKWRNAILRRDVLDVLERYR